MTMDGDNVTEEWNLNSRLIVVGGAAEGQNLQFHSVIIISRKRYEIGLWFAMEL